MVSQQPLQLGNEMSLLTATQSLVVNMVVNES